MARWKLDRQSFLCKAHVRLLNGRALLNPICITWILRFPELVRTGLSRRPEYVIFFSICTSWRSNLSGTMEPLFWFTSTDNTSWTSTMSFFAIHVPEVIAMLGSSNWTYYYPLLSHLRVCMRRSESCFCELRFKTYRIRIDSFRNKHIEQQSWHLHLPYLPERTLWLQRK